MLSLISLVNNDNVKNYALSRLFNGEPFCVNESMLLSYFNIDKSTLSTLTNNESITDDHFFTLALSLKENESATKVQLALVNAALDIINLSTGGGAVKEQVSYKSTFEEVLKENSDVLVRLKERE